MRNHNVFKYIQAISSHNGKTKANIILFVTETRGLHDGVNSFII